MELVKGMKVIQKGHEGDDLIVKLIEINNEYVNCRVKYKGNLKWNKNSKTFERNMSRWYKIMSIYEAKEAFKDSFN